MDFFGTLTFPHFIVSEVKMSCNCSPKAKTIQSCVRKPNNCPSFGEKIMSSCIRTERLTGIDLITRSVQNTGCGLQSLAYCWHTNTLFWVALPLPPVQCCLQTVKAPSQGVQTNCAFQHWMGKGGVCGPTTYDADCRYKTWTEVKNAGCGLRTYQLHSVFFFFLLTDWAKITYYICIYENCACSLRSIHSCFRPCWKDANFTST